MMEAIGRNSPIESTPLENINNDETNFKLNVVENSPHDEDDDDNNHKEGVDDEDANDDEDVVEVREQLQAEKSSLNSQIFVVDEDEEEKMSQIVSINGPNKTYVESNTEETQINDEAVIVNNEEIKQRVVEVEEEYPASHQLEQDNLDEKQIEKSQSDKCEPSREESTERGSPTNALQDVKQNEQIIDAQMQADEDLRSAKNPCRESVNSEENKRSPSPKTLALPLIVDVTEDSDEDELKSDDEKNVKEKSVENAENKVSMDRTLRIEIEDSLDSIASDKKDEDAVEIINITASTDACNVTADLDQTTPIEVDKSFCERGVQEDLKINSNHDVRDIEREVVSISDDESEHEENDEQNHQKKQHLQQQQQQQQLQQEQQEEEQQQQQHQQKLQHEQDHQQQQYQHQLQQQEEQQQQQDPQQQLQCSTIDIDDDVVGEPIENETLELEERKYIPMDVNDNNVTDEDGVAPTKIIQHGEVINLDEDSQDGMHIDIKMEEQTESKPATECITINEESEELPGEQEKLKNECSSDDSSSSIEFQASCSPHKVDDRQKISSPQQQYQGKFNGVDEHSNDGLTMDITDEEDDAVDNQRYENDERAENEKLQISHSQAVSPVWPINHQDSQDLAATIEADSFDVTDNFSDEEGEGDNLITSIKRQLLKNENSSPSVPKLNGEHKTPETDVTQAVIDVMQAVNDEAVDEQPSNVDINDEDEDDNNDDSSNLKIIDEQSNDEFFKENSRHTDEVSRSPRGPTLHLNESDDEASRFSMASEQSSSTATSSSHQLVIDHPSDEIETPLPSYPPPALPPPPPPPSFPELNNESDSQTYPFLPLKISLKRKLSLSGETYEASSPQQKMAHLDREDDSQQYDSVYNEQSADQQISPIINGENMELGQGAEQPTDLNPVSRSQSPSLQMVETAYQTDQAVVPAHEEVSQKGQNQEPMVTEMPLMNKSHEEAKTSTTRSSPLLNSLLMKKVPKQQSSTEKFDNFIAPPKPKKTKYLCFNCKSGSFSSLIALNEHQNICLANKFLFSAGPTASPPNATAIHTKKNSSTAAQNSPPSASPQQTPLEAAVAVPSPALTSQQPQPTPATPIEKRVYYQCSSCKTYHENWNLFLHIREIHKRHTCLYCIRMFPTAEKLSLHLEIKHDMEQNHFNSEEAFRKSIEMIDGRVSEARFLMCCTCQHVFLDHEPFSDHVCTEYIQACTLCGQKGRHTNQCKAQNEAKRSKVKKKSKLRDSRTGTKSLPPESSSLQSNPPTVMPQTEIAFNTPHMQTTNCDNVPSAPHHASFAPSSYTALPTLTHQTLHQSQQQLKLHNEDSNNSCNIVIDETCNSAYNNRSKPYNPYKALDEHERLQQEANATQPVLPPDRHQLTEQAVEKPEPVQPLIVPKFKLRVPKEFQKSVDAVISTSESEDDEDMVINEDEADKSESSRLSITPHGEMDVENESLANAEQSRSQDAGEECSKHSSGGAVDDDDSMDEPNSNLVRILQEIERTKLDIMRTKDALHSSSKATSGGQRQATISQSSSRAGDRNWSPTPPASPNAHWYTPRRPIIQGANITGVAASEGGQANEMQAQNEPSLQSMAPPQLPAGPIQREQRRNTTGSDMDMDIDETISGQPVQCIERPLLRAPSAEHETDKSVDITNESAVDKPNVSTDSSFGDVDIMNNSNTNAEEANKDERSEEENSQQMEEELTPHKTLTHDKRMLGESMETEQNTSTSEMDTPIKQEELNIEFSSDKEEEDKNESTEEPHPPLPPLPATEPAPPPPPPPPAIPADGIIVADEETISVDLQLDRPLEKFDVIEFVRICLKAVYPLCLYCNHARRIAVNGKSLVLHLIAQHRFAATVDSITAEELKPSTIVSKLKSYLPELEDHYFNSNSYCTYRKDAFTHPFNERIFECFQCRFVTSTHKELYLHNRKMHLRTAILCFMCRSNFFSFSEILCHVCPGESHKISVFDIKFRCCLCEVDNIPSPFRLMVHLRKKHFACDVCLEDCRDQGRLSSHVWKHKLHHLCYRCGIAYRNKMDITKHLFWKHGTESIICKRCLQKRWRHVYHFCVPPADFICDICNLCFSKATYLKVHKRIHTGDLRYPCTDENCEQKFISRRLLLKHTAEHQMFEMNESQQAADEKEKLLEQKESTDEVKKEQQIQIKEENLDDVKELPLKEENKVETGEQADAKTESSGEKTTESPGTTSKSTADNDNISGNSSCKQRKKKKSKRSKESLEDLNLTAPNLSESDSSDESDVEVKSKSGDDSLVPKVMLSPPSDTENLKDDDDLGAKKETHADEKVLDIWKNLMQAQGAGDSTDTMRDPKDSTENYKPPPVKMHVAQSDHDYCLMTQPEKPKPKESVVVSQPSPQKRNKTAKSPRHNSARRSDASSGSSSSGSSSDSSCSCGSNCSCSSSNSGSSSSSSSSNDSDDSSGASHASRKRHRKKSERDRMRKKSESLSPMKKHNMSEGSGRSILGGDVDVGTEETQPTEENESTPKEPLFYESDLETAESETDEEFYDEHPQKLATELLAQKRAQLMAQTRLSPSHNFDIVENSRPSTPSLPDEVARERKIKLKKKKRERKSTSRSIAPGVGVPPLKLNLSTPASPNATQVPESDNLTDAAQQIVPATTTASSIDPPSYDLMRRQSFGIAETTISAPQQFNTAVHGVSGQQLTPRPIGPQHHLGRISEGSSCSDADGSLKRSKRARRPNKFYGYTSDEENNVSGLGQPVMMGMRAIKPQPPPQLTWRKEDLPTPSKSILNNNKIKNPRTPKTPNTPQTPGGNLFNTNISGPMSTTLKKKGTVRGNINAKNRKRNNQKSKVGSKLPPIPTLKIRSSQIGLTPNVPSAGGGTNHIPASQIYSSSKESDEDDDDDEEVDSTDTSSEDDGAQEMVAPSTSGTNVAWNASLLQAPGTTPNAPVAALLLPQVAPAPPPPQASAFNQKIPPALLPNPDFATLQYFKANNIRYPIRPPAGARQAREGESVYCYCRCPYDEVSEMIACDGENCLIEWFHFECVGIMVAPQGKWFCAECRPKYSEELYPTASTA